MLQNGGATTAAAESVVKDTTTQGFVKDVIEESKRQPVLVDFWAPWCGPCKQLTPILEKVVKAAKGKVKLVKMNIDEHPAIPGQMGIQSIPAVIAFVNGQPVDGFMGALPESQVIAFLERVTKGKIGAEDKDPLKAADEALAAGNAAEAAESLRANCWPRTAATSPRSPGLRAATSQTGALEQAKQTLAMVPEAKRDDAAVAAARAALELAEQAKSVGPVDELQNEGRRQSARPSGALRSRRRAQRQGQARRGGRATDRRSSSATANGTRTARASSWCSSSRPGARPTRRPSKAASGCRRSCFRDAFAPGRHRPAG